MLLSLSYFAFYLLVANSQIINTQDSPASICQAGIARSENLNLVQTQAHNRAEIQYQVANSKDYCEQVAQLVSKRTNHLMNKAIQNRLDAITQATAAELLARTQTETTSLSKAGSDMVFLSDITISIKNPSNTIQTIKKNIEIGELSFEEAAQKYSETHSRYQGGKIGWVAVQKLHPNIQQALGNTCNSTKILGPIKVSVRETLLLCKQYLTAAEMAQNKQKRTITATLNTEKKRAFLNQHFGTDSLAKLDQSDKKKLYELLELDVAKLKIDLQIPVEAEVWLREETNRRYLAQKANSHQSISSSPDRQLNAPVLYDVELLAFPLHVQNYPELLAVESALLANEISLEQAEADLQQTKRQSLQKVSSRELFSLGASVESAIKTLPVSQISDLLQDNGTGYFLQVLQHHVADPNLAPNRRQQKSIQLKQIRKALEVELNSQKS